MSAFIVIYLTSIFSEGKKPSQPCSSCAFQPSPVLTMEGRDPSQGSQGGRCDVGSWGGSSALQEVPPGQFPRAQGASSFGVMQETLGGDLQCPSPVIGEYRCCQVPDECGRGDMTPHGAPSCDSSHGGL